MTAREDRDWKNKNNFGERRMNMLCECLHQDPAHRVFTFGPSPAATPSFISSPSIRRKKKKKSRITLCAANCSPSSETVLTLVVARGVTFGPSPMAIYKEIKKVKAQRKIKSWINGFKKKTFKYQCNHCNFHQ